MNTIILIYRGYYRNALLAVTTNKERLKEYLKNVRGLTKDDYYIEESSIDEDEIDKLYPKLFMTEYLKDLYLPQRDIDTLEREIETEFQHYIDILDGMRYYYNQIQYIDYMEKRARQLKETIHNMEEDLTTKKTLKKLRKQIIKASPVMSKNIEDYISNNKIDRENQELDRQYRYHLLYD